MDVNLLYLMVFIDSHTISKSIINDGKVNDIFEFSNDIDTTINPKSRRDRIRHNRLYYKDDDFTDAYKEIKPYTELETTSEKITKKTTLKTTTEHAKLHKSTKRRIGNFWRRLRGKDKKKEKEDKHKSNQRKRRIPKNRECASKFPIAKYFRKSSPKTRSRRKYRNQFTLRQPELVIAKRDVSSGQDTSPTRPYSNSRKDYKSQTGNAPEFGNMQKLGMETVEPIRTSETTDSLKAQLATMTSQIINLKEKYEIKGNGPNSYTLASSYDNLGINTPTATTTQKNTESAFAGSREIEELLDDKNIKAIQMVSEQNPLVTDNMSNSDIDAAFDAASRLSTFVSSNNIAKSNEKRTVAPTNELILNDSELVNNTESHNLVARSITANTMTIAHNVEDMLQRELKNFYNKVKHKVSHDFHKEVRTVKSTLKKGYSKTTSKLSTIKTRKPAPMTSTTDIPKTKSRLGENMTEKSKEKITTTTTPTVKTKYNEEKDKMKHTDTPESVNPKITDDDCKMLNLYEQMLRKTQDANIRKIITTKKIPLDIKNRRDHFRLSKRNPETLTDVKLREVVQNLYDDGVNMPIYDYNESSDISSRTTTENNIDYNETVDDINQAEIMGKNTLLNNMGDSSDVTQSKEAARAHTKSSVSDTDTSYKGLITKIYYDDFVNGYKHYLKFQKEQNRQNFSNLVKYQAHRHHSVDDIGKFILNKIPPLSSYREKRLFYESDDIDYQEITTKSDDSWFRKHFYFFIDNGPPKKFHTSETVELKTFTTETVPKLELKDELSHLTIGSDSVARNVKEAMDLDDLSKFLDAIKNKQSGSLFRAQPKSLNERDVDIYNEQETGIKMVPKLVYKLFGSKRRQAPKKVQDTTDYFTTIEMFSENPQVRLKRKVALKDHENKIMDDFTNRDLEEKSVTKVFTDATQRETNKYGYVDIDVVPRQTASIKHRKSTKKSKFKNLFKKFHLKHSKPKKEHPKRSCYYSDDLPNRRNVRFNPLKKLKYVLKANTDSGLQIPNMLDYNMMYSRFVTLKPDKYNNLLSIDEIEKQIPNITNFDYESIMTGKTTKPSSYFFKLYDNDHDLLYHHCIPSSAATKQQFIRPFLVLTGKLKTTTKTTQSTTTTTPSVKKTLILKTPPSNVMTINLRTLKPTRRSTQFMTTEHPIMTLDDVQVILNQIQHKLLKSTSDYPRILTPPIIEYKKDVPTLNHGNKGLIIESKLTRIAKFPIPKRHFEIGLDEAESINAGDEYMSFHDGPVIKFIHDMTNRHTYPVKKKIKGKELKNLHHSNLPKCNETFKHTDYFNDLLLWDHDILNMDSVPKPLWILKNTSEENFTTPNMNNLLSEANKIKAFIDNETMSFRSVVTPSANLFLNVGAKAHDEKRLPSLYKEPIGSIVMDDSTTVTSKDIMIQKEAKYYQSNKPKTTGSQLKSNNFISKLYRLRIDNHQRNMKKKNKDSRSHTASFSFDNNELKSARNEPAIVVDTTLMAYDDDLNSVINGLEIKKLSRNSQKSGKASPKQNIDSRPPFLKKIKAPTQYYTTPLPMKSFEFNKFLKENKMDIESVTSPILELPTINDKNWPTPSPITVTVQPFYVTTDHINKISKETLTTKNLPKISNLKSVMHKSISTIFFKKPTPKFVANRGLVNEKNSFWDAFDRYKRHTKQNKPRFATINKPNKEIQKDNYYNKIKKKMKERLFEKKGTAASMTSSNMFAEEPQNKQVEVTILNLDDMIPQPFENYEISSAKIDEIYPDRAENESMFKTIDLIQNEDTYGGLLCDNVFKEQTSSTTTTENPSFDLTKSTKYVNPVVKELPTIASTKQSHPSEKIMCPNVLNKIPHTNNLNNNDMPKRVQISGHHYKYNVFKKNRKRGFKKSRLKHGMDNKATAPKNMRLQMELGRTRYIRSPIIFRKGENKVVAFKKTNRTLHRSRHAWNVNMNSASSTSATMQPISLIYDLKHLKATPSSSPDKQKGSSNPMTHRNQILFKISSLLQNRFKSLQKNLTTKRSDLTTRSLKSSKKCKVSVKDVITEETTKWKTTAEVIKTTNKEADEENNAYSVSYNELGTQKNPPSTHTTTVEPDYYQEHNEVKRDVEQQNIFTAKDVAALEVVVDLMKNTLNDEQKVGAITNRLIVLPSATKSPDLKSSTNSIQVQIAIPYDLQIGKKRSPFSPVRVRKVFSAKMLTPVDLEYQVNSFEHTVAPTSTKMSTSANGPSPGVYLLVDKSNNGYVLKPIISKIDLSDLKTRQETAGTTARKSEPREETTRSKNLAKVTLSREFIALINQQLIEMYKNMSRVNKDVTNNKQTARSVLKSHKLKEGKGKIKRCAEKTIYKRRIDWEAVKKYFGHNRVCNCKCKKNKAMCKACAASDAVINELIFEFDNIGQYMKDHCTEIQTFFWMNPMGGQKLLQSVNRIDKSLKDYYKRVKGKCEGRTCKTFTAAIDEGKITKTSKIIKQDVMSNLINDLTAIADDLNKTLSLHACFNDKLKEEGEKFVHSLNSYIMKKSFDKRLNPSTNQKDLMKNGYSLDNINVNIICNPEVSSTKDEQTITTIVNSHRWFDCYFNISKHKDHNKFKKLFPRKSKKKKLFKFLVSESNKTTKEHFKREIDSQIVTPLISDSGGAFWYDYLKAGTSEPRFARDSVKDKPNIEIAVVHKGVDETTKVPKLTEKPSSMNSAAKKYMRVETSSEGTNQGDIETTTDSLSQNIKQLLQLLGSLQDIEAMNENKNTNQPTLVLNDVTENNQGANDDKTKRSITCKDNSKEKRTTSDSNNSDLDKQLEEIKNFDLTEFVTKITGCTNLATSKTTTISTTMKGEDSFNSSNNIVVIKDTKNVTTSKPTSETTKTLSTNSSTKTTANAPVAPKKDGNTKSKPLLKDTTPGFIAKLKTATLQLFRKKEIFGESAKRRTKTTTTTTFTPVSFNFTALLDKINNIGTDLDFEESSKTTTSSPTILIFDEYDNQLGSDIDYKRTRDAERYRNLLLSVIQYETDKLNDEWRRIADRSYENDIKRNANDISKVKTTKSKKPQSKLHNNKYAILQRLMNLELPDPGTNTKKPDGLLSKIVNKMGIKFVTPKKMVLKNLAHQEEQRRNKINNVRKRKLSINTSNISRPNMPGTTEEACDTRRTSETSQLCDIQATIEHITELQKTLPSEEFENLVKNISCYKYKNADSCFFIPYEKKQKRWDWIRSKRYLKLHFSGMKDEPDFGDEIDVVNFDDDSFDRFIKGDNGIYKIIKRKKRTAGLEALDRGLRNIPDLVPGKDEVYAMVGDTVTLECVPHTAVRNNDGKFCWKTDRKRMLNQDNMDVDGASVSIQNVGPRNVGSYTCSLDHTVKRSIRLNVLTIPSFDVVFLLVYKTENNCSYDDLKAIQRLGSLMAEETRCGKACSIRIDEPVCQRDRDTNNTLFRSTAVISVTPRDVNCSLHCRRDIVSSLVMLCANNTAALSSIRVLISKDGVNETLIPWKELIRPVVTHTLRKKDTNGHHEYHKLVSLLAPGKVDVVLICPAGYYLLPEYKLCSSCPPNTCSQAGDNTCRACPRGTRADPGAQKCHVVEAHPRRYDWWWYPPCGYVVACSGVVFGCTVCVLVSLIVHILSRSPDPQKDQVRDDEQNITSNTETSVTAAHAQVPNAKPLSPSRVLFPRFFKPSLTSSRATDSQETKFELWKEKHMPPPLPPIDFDI